MSNQQPKPDSKKYDDLIADIRKGVIKIPKFQRDFVWSLEKTAQLLDSILKGYPIGTFILWQTSERMADVKRVGNLDIPDTPEDQKVQYVLDGQQRITSLYAVYYGARIKREGEKKFTDYKDIFVNLERNADDDDVQIITSEKPVGDWITLNDVLHFTERMIDIHGKYNEKHFQQIHTYNQAFATYDFSTVLLRKDSIDSAIEVFTRINTGGQTLTLFEIVSAKTYDEVQHFDMEGRWSEFINKLQDKNYEGVSKSTILYLLSLVLSPSRECRRQTILKLEKQQIIDTWDCAISCLEDSIDYFRTSYGIPVSQLLPYDTLLVPFGYFFFFKKDKPDGQQRKYLEEFFWRVCLSSRYSTSVDSNLAKDIKRIDNILNGERPHYEDIKLQLGSSDDLVSTEFRASNSYCKAILCLLASHGPRDFQDNSRVILDNSWLKVANSRNYHHFFPKAYLRAKGIENANSLMNITFVSEHLNKKKIGSRAPSKYVAEFAEHNEKIANTFASHLIEYKGFGIESDDYGVFLKERAKRIFNELTNRLELERPSEPSSDIYELILNGETETVEFKSSLRYDFKTKEKNDKLEYAVIKTIAAFLNTEGGTLIIGVNDNKEILGLDEDISTLKKQNVDGFQLHLMELYKSYIGVELARHVKVAFRLLENKTICVVQVSKSSRRVYTKFQGQEHYFVRVGCASVSLSRDEQSLYEQT